MSGRAIAGTLASTRSLLGLSHVFPQSSILYGPRSGNSSSAFPGDTRTVTTAPAAVATTARRGIMCFDVYMGFVSCISGTLHNAALSTAFLKPTDVGSWRQKCLVWPRLSITWEVISTPSKRRRSYEDVD